MQYKIILYYLCKKKVRYILVFITASNMCAYIFNTDELIFLRGCHGTSYKVTKNYKIDYIRKTHAFCLLCSAC